MITCIYQDKSFKNYNLLNALTDFSSLNSSKIFIFLFAKQHICKIIQLCEIKYFVYLNINYCSMYRYM